MSQLSDLTTPILTKYVHENPSGGGSYVAHPVITQKLLMDIGPFDFELGEIVRGYVDALKPNPNAKSKRHQDGRPALDGAVVGAVCRITCTIDGRTTKVEEVGDCEDPHNWPHDGARLKDAMSDALKRCAMRLGVGLSIWAKNGDEYFLGAVIAKREAAKNGS